MNQVEIVCGVKIRGASGRKRNKQIRESMKPGPVTIISGIQIPVGESNKEPAVAVLGEGFVKSVIAPEIEEAPM